jgi:hypothetical protein
MAEEESILDAGPGSVNPEELFGGRLEGILAVGSGA